MVANTPMATITTVSMVTPAATAAAGGKSSGGETESNQGCLIAQLWMSAHLLRGEELVVLI